MEYIYLIGAFKVRPESIHLDRWKNRAFRNLFCHCNCRQEGALPQFDSDHMSYVKAVANRPQVLLGQQGFSGCIMPVALRHPASVQTLRS